MRYASLIFACLSVKVFGFEKALGTSLCPQYNSPATGCNVKGTRFQDDDWALQSRVF